MLDCTTDVTDSEADDNDDEGSEDVSYIRAYESDAERIHSIKRRNETYPEAIRRIIDGYEDRDEE